MKWLTSKNTNGSQHENRRNQERATQHRDTSFMFAWAGQQRSHRRHGLDTPGIDPGRQPRSLEELPVCSKETVFQSAWQESMEW